MARRHGSPLFSRRYCASAHIVHDLDNEQRACEINDALEDGQLRAYHYLSGARAEGYLPCPHCMPAFSQPMHVQPRLLPVPAALYRTAQEKTKHRSVAA